MFTIEDLYVGYEKDKEVLKGINLSMKPGKTHGFVGLNGAGKTTLLHTIYAFIKPRTGKIDFNDKPLRRHDIAYLEAENFFYTYMTGREYLSLFPAGTSGFSVEGWEELFSLPLDDITESYSTGMKKRLALLAVLKLDKPILILDEPFNGLDLEGTHLLSMILSRLHERGKTILITSHIYETLTGCCDYIHYLNKGIIEGSYPKEDFALLQTHLKETMQERSFRHIEELL